MLGIPDVSAPRSVLNLANIAGEETPAPNPRETAKACNQDDGACVGTDPRGLPWLSGICSADTGLTLNPKQFESSCLHDPGSLL